MRSSLNVMKRYYIFVLLCLQKEIVRFLEVSYLSCLLILVTKLVSKVVQLGCLIWMIL